MESIPINYIIGFLPLADPLPLPGTFFLLGITVIYLPLNKLSVSLLAFNAPSLVANSIKACLNDTLLRRENTL